MRQLRLQFRPAPAPLHRTSWASPTYRGLGSLDGDPSQGGIPAGGCIYPTPNPATNNLVGSVNNQANGGFKWDCDGALALIDPFYVYKGPKQPNILTDTPEYSIPVGQPYDGYTNATLQIPCTVVGGIQLTPPNCGNTYLQNLANCKTATPTLCPNGLASPGPIGVVYACGDQTLPAYASAHHTFPAITPPALPCAPSQGSIGGVVYLPYCSPGSIALGPTDVPGGYDGKGAGDVSSLTTPSTGRNTTFANILLGCNPFYNGNNSGTGQGQLTVNIQENYSLALNTISATSNPTFGCATGVLGVGCRSASQPRRHLFQPIRLGPVRSMTSSCRVLIPRSTRFRCSLTTTTTSTRRCLRAAPPSILRCRRPMAAVPAVGRIRSCRRTP